MGNRQQQSQQAQNQPQELSQEQRQQRYEELYNRAPTVQETLTQQPQPSQQQPQQQQQQVQPVQQQIQPPPPQEQEASEQFHTQEQFYSEENDELVQFIPQDDQSQMEASLYELRGKEQKEEQKESPQQFQQEKSSPPIDLLNEPEPVVQNVTPQKMIVPPSKEELTHQWLSQLMEIDTAQNTFQSANVDYSTILTKPYLTIQDLLDDYILLILQSQLFFRQDVARVDWLINVIAKLSLSFDTSSEQTNIRVGQHTFEIKTIELKQLLSSICSFLTTLVLFPETFDLQIPKEDPHFIQQQNPMQFLQMQIQQTQPTNQLADKLYESLFRRDVFSQNLNALQAYLFYLDKEAELEERNTIVELMIKRAIKDCQISLLNTSSLVQALTLLSELADYPNLLNQMLKESLAFYHPKVVRSGRDLQLNTLLGRILSLSAFHKESQEWRKLFTIKNIRQGVPDSFLNPVRDNIRQVNDGVHILLLKIAKMKNMRDKILNYFSLVLQLNINKEKLFHAPLQASCSSAGFLSNFLYIMLKFCQPFLSSITVMKEKAATIDHNLTSYLKKHPLLSKIYAQTDLLNPELTPLTEPEEFSVSPHFVGSLYLLTMKALHFHVPIITEYYKYLEEIHKLFQAGKLDKMNELLPIKAAYEVSLLDRGFVNLTIKFQTFQCLVPMSLLNLEPEEESKQELQQLPQNHRITIQPRYPYGVLPTTFLEDIHDVLQVLVNTSSPALNDNLMEIQIQAEFLTLTLNNRELVKNPHLRVKGIQTLAMFVPHKTNPRQREPNLHYLFQESPIIKQNLIQALIKVFVDAENTGQSNQFYEKFQFRFFFCKIFNYLISNLKQIYSSQLEENSKEDKVMFLEFANLYLNDMIYLLDECFAKLEEMKKFEEEDQSNMPQHEQMNRQMTYDGHKRTLSVFSIYLHEYYKNIQIISETEPLCFLTEEIREKLVNNMNYTVEQLNGENSLRYKTKAMKEVKFEPKFIMGNIIELYINFSHHDIFLEQIVKDQRSFSIELFERTARKLEKNQVISMDKLECFTKILEKLEKMLKEKKRFDEAILDVPVPSEFLDPLLSEIMRDPVLLPNSKLAIDRITIKKHLLNNKTDPFNRTPLTEDQLIEMPELKARIERFLEENTRRMD